MEINWGIIGAGYIAGQFVKDYAHVKDGQIKAIASRSGEKAESFAGEYGIEKAYEGYDNLLKDEDIHAVYIATPHNLHYENTLSAIKNKKAVLCEKPAAINARQLKEMIELAKKRKCALHGSHVDLSSSPCCTGKTMDTVRGNWRC